MNAVVREKHEVPVVAQDSKALDEFRADVRELRAADAALATKIDAVGAKVDAVHVTLVEKVDAVHVSLLEKIASVQEKIDEKFSKFEEKLSKLNNDVASLQGLQKTILWVIATVVSIASLVIAVTTVGKNLHWF